MPALLMRMSRRDSAAVNVEAADAMEEKEVRSRGRWTISHGEEMADLMDDMASDALDAVRAAR